MAGKRHWVSLFLWVMIAGPATAFCSGGQGQPSEQQQIEKARQAIQNKKYKDAEKLLKQALSIKPDSPEANLLLGLVYRNKGDLDNAFKHVREAIRLLPYYPDTHYLLANLYSIKNQLHEAAEEIKTAIEQGARSSSLYMLKANLEIRDRKHEGALKSYETALQLSQPSDEGYQGLKDHIEALKSYVEFEANRKKDVATYTKPILNNRPQPLYSSLAREKKVGGIVHVAIQVDEQGKPGSVLIFKGIGYALDEEAIKAARKMRFTPATRNGEPVAYWLVAMIEFNIK
jgi:TonB family protein